MTREFYTFAFERTVDGGVGDTYLSTRLITK
jgi:hypothetical protein